jgi:putative cardiolipin synthase
LATIRDRGRNGEGPPKEYLQRKPEYVRRILGAEGMLWARGQAIGEPPVRQAADAAKPSSEVARAMAIARQNSTREVVYEAAYFVPGDRGVEVLTALAARGVGVRVLTNSLAATDVVAVHAGYAPYREALVAGGVDLYEYRPDADRPTPAGGHRVRLGRSESALHAKIAIYDRKLVWVGSANFDPRSRRLNTEAGLLIESPPLAERLLAGIARDFSPQHSWRLTLEASGDSPRRLVWSGERDGKTVRLEHEPDAGFWRSLSVVFYSLIPGLEDLL